MIIYLHIFMKDFVNSFVHKNNIKINKNILYSTRVIPCPDFNDLFIEKPKVSCKSMRKPPLCSNCKNYIPVKTSICFNNDVYFGGFGLCKAFGNKYDLIRYSFAKHCRENENQCGKEGYFYEEIDYFDYKNNIIYDDDNDDINYFQ